MNILFLVMMIIGYGVLLALFFIAKFQAKKASDNFQNQISGMKTQISQFEIKIEKENTENTKATYVKNLNRKKHNEY